MVAGALYRDRSTEGARWLKQWIYAVTADIEDFAILTSIKREGPNVPVVCRAKFTLLQKFCGAAVIRLGGFDVSFL